jgi:teichuronic acid biosynthesis glycosyltransferase TuaC
MRHAIFGSYGGFARVPRNDVRRGLHVAYPRTLVIPKVGSALSGLSMALAVLPTVAKLRREGFDFDIIDAYYLYPDGVAASLLGSWFRRPVVLTSFGSDVTQIPNDAVLRVQMSWSASRAQGQSTVCLALKHEMQRVGLAPGPLNVILHGVDASLFAPPVDRPALRTELGMSGPTLVSAGWLIPRKGHHLAISALRQLPGVSLVIVGTGPMEHELQALACREGVADRVSFSGSVSQAQLCKILGAADGLVLCSDREGIANVILEAMACGTPVVATPVWGTPEIIDRPEAGILMRNGTSKAMAEAVRALLIAPPNRPATRLYAERFTWQATADQHVALLTEAVAQHQLKSGHRFQAAQNVAINEL